jgi:ABC-type glycerol-3-phosphate transport system substrate-binding protein
MHMSHYKRAIAAAMGLALVLAGCGGGGSEMAAAPVTPTTPPPIANPDYTAFVKQLLLLTSETMDPISVDGVTYAFADEDNANAYADILPP